MSQVVFRFFARANTFSLKRTVPRLAVAANLAFALLLRLVMVSLAPAYHVTIRLIRETKTNFGYIGLIWSAALACRTLLTWLWIGVKDIVLILWVLTLLGVAMLAVWISLSSFLDGVEGPGLFSWFLVLVWLGVLTVWTLLTYFWVELFKINLVLWGLTLLYCGIDGARLHLR
jgi:hypothetical protein